MRFSRMGNAGFLFLCLFVWLFLETQALYSLLFLSEGSFKSALFSCSALLYWIDTMCKTMIWKIEPGFDKCHFHQIYLTYKTLRWHSGLCLYSSTFQNTYNKNNSRGINNPLGKIRQQSWSWWWWLAPTQSNLFSLPSVHMVSTCVACQMTGSNRFKSQADIENCAACMQTVLSCYGSCPCRVIKKYNAHALWSWAKKLTSSILFKHLLNPSKNTKVVQFAAFSHLPSIGRNAFIQASTKFRMVKNLLKYSFLWTPFNKTVRYNCCIVQM